MAKAIAARLSGDDYQSRVFWIQVCRMFDERPKVVKVEFEAQNIKSLDDVVVHYDPPIDDRDDHIRTDFYQVKFHVDYSGAFTWQALTDPKFINASSVSLLQRVRNAQQQYAADGTGCRFIIYSPWTIHPDDEMAQFVSASDGRIRWEVLSKGGVGSKMGRVREAWKQHIGLKSDDELRRTLAPVRIRQGQQLQEMAEQLNQRLRLAGLIPVKEGSLTHPYDDLSRAFIKEGRVAFTRAEIEVLCKKHGLWRGLVLSEPEAKRLGLRSFMRSTEYLEDATDELLCLVRYFDGRRIQEPVLWQNVYSEIESFLSRSTREQRPYHLHLPAHGSIAFVAGYCLDSKSGVNIVPIQSTLQGRVVWRPGQTIPDAAVQWQCESASIEGDGNEVAVAISVTHQIASDVIQYVKRSLPTIGRVLHFALPVASNSSIKDGTHALNLAQQLVSEIRKQRSDSERGTKLHLLWAAPNAFIFFLGQLSRSLGPCVLYEYDFDTGAAGAYGPSLSLPQSQIAKGTGVKEA